MKRRILTILLALCVALTMMPTVAMADTPTGTALTEEYLSNEAIDYKLTGGDSASNAVHYYLNDDVDVVEISKTINVTGHVILDLNGHVLKMKSSIYGGTATGSVIKVENSGNLILQDSNSDNLTHKFKVQEDGLWVLDEDNGTETITGGIITGGTGTNVKVGDRDYTYGGGVYVDLGNFTMNGGNIVGCSSTAPRDSSYGGGISANGKYDEIEKCKVNINGGNIIGCTAGDAGGGVFAEAATVNMSGGNILNCTAFAAGGGGVQINLGTFTMSGGSIKYCKYTGDGGDSKGGGAVRLYQIILGVTTFNMSGGEITDCTSKNYGGGVFVNDGKCVFNMTGGTIKDCESADENLSDGVYLRGGDENQMNAEGGRIDDNVYVNKKNDNNKGKITHSSDNMGCTAFHGKVTNNGTIEYGIFYGGITGEGTISDSKYTVSFDLNGGNGDIPVTQVFVGTNSAKAIKPSTDPTRAGCKFLDWHEKDSNGNLKTENFNFNNTQVSQNIILYANWEDKQAPTFDSLKDGETYRGDVIFTVSDNVDVASVTANGELLTPSSGKYTLKSGSGKVTVTATDNAGNSNIITVTVKSYSSGTTVQKPSVSLGTDAKTEKAADGSTVYTTAEGSIVLSRDGRTAEITPADGYEVANVSVNGKDMGAVTTLTGLKTGDEIVVDFQKTEEAKKAEVKAAAAKLSPIARSVKTAKGNIKVTLKFDKETESLIKEMQEIGYTVKYKFYRSTKKSSGYKAMLTKSGRSYTNTNGKNGTKYYYKARVQIYDKDGKLIAQTALKQCQYASRTW